jgi:hypothetical protein
VRRPVPAGPPGLAPCRCALVPTADACKATWGCRVMPQARRRSERRLQGESQVPSCVPSWFASYGQEQQDQYLAQVDDPSSNVSRPQRPAGAAQLPSASAPRRAGHRDRRWHSSTCVRQSTGARP